MPLLSTIPSYPANVIKSNLSLQFGLYLSFPIGYMYYFGTNLENRFSVPGFWPTQEQSHRIPFERDEIRAEIERHQRLMRERKERESEREKLAVDSVV
jgi:protein PET100